VRDAALEIMVARRAVHWCCDLSNERESFRREARLFHEVAGKADEIRREPINCADNFRCILGVAFVVKIAEMNEAAVPVALSQFGHV
jgi:hypothetical protein